MKRFLNSKNSDQCKIKKKKKEKSIKEPQIYQIHVKLL